MKYGRKNGLLALGVLMLGVPGALLAGPFAHGAWRLVGLFTPSIYAYTAARCTGFVVHGYLWALLLTVLIPKAPNWSLSSSYALPWTVTFALFALTKGGLGSDGVLLIILPILMYPAGYLGVG